MKVTHLGVLPRIQLCSDGSYCCNDDALCCSKKAGKFLDPSGNIVAKYYNSRPSATSASTPAATTVHAASAASASNGLSTAAKGAIGALVGVVVLLTVLWACIFFRRRRREVANLRSKPIALEPRTPSQDVVGYYLKGGMGYGPAELRGIDGMKTSSPREMASELPH